MPNLSRWILYPILFVVGLLAIAIAMVVVVLTLTYPNLPSLEVLTDYRPKIPLRVFTVDGQMIGEFGEERREIIRFPDVPEVMKQAILAAEDERFYQHHGIDYQGLFAAVKDALHVAQRMVRHVERSRQTLQQQTLSLSFGVVQVQPDEKLTDAIRRALLALDEARSQGDSRFVSAEDEDGMPVFAPSQTLGHSNF